MFENDHRCSPLRTNRTNQLMCVGLGRSLPARWMHEGIHGAVPGRPRKMCIAQTVKLDGFEKKWYTGINPHDSYKFHRNMMASDQRLASLRQSHCVFREYHFDSLLKLRTHHHTWGHPPCLDVWYPIPSGLMVSSWEASQVAVLLQRWTHRKLPGPTLPPAEGGSG